MIFSFLWSIFLWMLSLFNGGNTDLPTSTPSQAPVRSPAMMPQIAPTPKAAPVAVPVKSPSSLPVSLPVPITAPVPFAAPVPTPKAAPVPVPVAPVPVPIAPVPVPVAPVPVPVAPVPVPVVVPTPAQTPVTPPIATPTVHNGLWIEVTPNATLSKRHEACFVMVKQLAYLIGGRGRKNVDVYNPRTGQWTARTGPPIELHHMQCVAVPSNDQIFIVSSWTGSYPREQNTEFIYIYNILTDTWTTRDGLPEPRRRGGAASILVGRKIYVSHGNRSGHETGNFSTSYGWLDYYHIDNDTWVTELPDAPNPRDHTGGALLQDRYICVAGGRDGGAVGFFNQVVLPTDCFDLMTNTWSVEADIPQGRAGSSYGRTCDGNYLIVAGGEGFGQAWSNVDVFDGQNWMQWDNLTIARHGSGLALDCTQNSTCRNQVHIASGAASQGGSREILSVETYFPTGSITTCS